MWRADADPHVLTAAAQASAGPGAVDLTRFGLRTVAGWGAEHVRFAVLGEVFRLDVTSGTVSAGPVELTYLVARDWRMAAQIDTVRRLERRLSGIRRGNLKGSSRIARCAMALRAHDARAAGASLRQIAWNLYGPGEWPGPGEFRKSAARRLVAMGDMLVREGPLPILNM